MEANDPEFLSSLEVPGEAWRRKQRFAKKLKSNGMKLLDTKLQLFYKHNFWLFCSEI